jgi:NADH dehydrogenase FAD-containing subunit
MSHEHTTKHVVIVGGGFAGIACARELARHPGVRITLLDKNNYHQFQPLLYQVATSQLGPGDVAYSLRKVFYNSTTVDVKLANVAAVDPTAQTATTTTGEVYRGDYLVLAVGAQANFFKTPGADRHAFPMYSLDDAVRLRSRILQVFEDACRNPKLLDEGALNFVIVGAGATGVETAGALAELIQGTMAAEYPDLAVSSARIHLVDHGHTVLAPFSDRAHDYAEKVLQEAGVQLRLKTGVKEVGPGHVLLSDNTTIKTRVVVWAGGLMAAPLSGRTGLPQGHGGRIDVQPDLTVKGFPALYVLGDFANTPDAAGATLPQLGSVAQQAGQWAARNILADIAGQPRTAFQYRDKGIMAMITRRAAVVEIGPKRHELDGWLAAVAWRGVHVSLLSGVRNKVEAFVKWTWAHFSRDRGPQVLDRTDAARIDWEDDAVEAEQVRKPLSVAAATAATAAAAVPRVAADPARRSTDPTVRLTSPEPAPHYAPVTHSATNLPDIVSREYDVIIVGTGAGGGTLARHLAASGKRILLLERGDYLPREKANWDADEVFVKNRYVSPDTWYDAEGKPFQPGVHYFVGGATKMYGAALFRLRKEDFKELRHHDGMSPAWPISYEDLEPYYTRAEKLFYVHGLRGADPTEPPASEPYPYPPVAHEPRIQELSDRLAKAGYHPFPAPCGLLLNEKHHQLSVCLKCDTCDGYPCLVHAKADAEVTGVLPALAHPNVTLVRHARVIRLNTGPTGREVTEVVVAPHHGHPLVFKGHMVVLAAGAANSAKILLQSANDKHPNGLANGSDQVGRNFMFHNSQAVVALSRQPNPTVFQKTLSINDFYFGAADFPYPLGNIQMLGKSKGPMFRDDAPRFAPGWSLDLMARHALDFWLTTEDLPDPKNRITVAADGNIQLSYTPNNQEPTRRLLAKVKDMLGQLDCHPHLIPNSLYLSKSIPIAGVGHQAGTCRFGTDPKTSVLDVNCKAHELDNLYVVDTSFFVSIGAVNPSLTAIANALRVGDHLLERLG